jgi:hypothetical protein
MAKIPAPKSKKGKPPEPAAAPANLENADPNDLKPLNFKVPAEFHREFKTYAASHSMSMLVLLREGFEAVKKQRGT